MKIYIVVATDMVNRQWKTWIIGVFDSKERAENYLFSNGCVRGSNPVGNEFYHDGIRTFDICEHVINEPSKNFRFCHAAGL